MHCKKKMRNQSSVGVGSRKRISFTSHRLTPDALSCASAVQEKTCYRSAEPPTVCPELSGWLHCPLGDGEGGGGNYCCRTPLVPTQGQLPACHQLSASCSGVFSRWGCETKVRKELSSVTWVLPTAAITLRKQLVR